MQGVESMELGNCFDLGGEFQNEQVIHQITVRTEAPFMGRERQGNSKFGWRINPVWCFRCLSGVRKRSGGKR